MDNDKDKNEIFEEAFEMSIPEIKEDANVVDITQAENAVSENISSDSDKWKKLEEKMNGPFADRFIQAMESLGDRDFIRNYLKAIEYFRPKVVREEKEKPLVQEDNLLQVNVMVINNETGKIEEVKINELNDKIGG